VERGGPERGCGHVNVLVQLYQIWKSQRIGSSPESIKTEGDKIMKLGEQICGMPLAEIPERVVSWEEYLIRQTPFRRAPHILLQLQILDNDLCIATMKGSCIMDSFYNSTTTCDLPGLVL
jgi:hypothetical protein